MKIQGYFSSIKKAKETAEALKKAGFYKVNYDINDEGGGLENAERNIAGSENGSSLSSLTLESGDPVVDGSKAPIAAANPMASGIGDFEETANYQYEVTAYIEEERKEEAKQIIRDQGGTLYDPNVQKPEGLENVDMWDMIEKMSKDPEIINQQDNMYE